MLGRKKRTELQNPPIKKGRIRKTPEVRKYTRNAKDAIVDFLQQHNDQLLTQEDIARGSGTAKSKIGKLVKELVDEGRVVSSEPIPRVGTRYFVNESVQSSQEEATPDTAGSAQPQNILISDVIENLIWSFIRETRSTDVLLFLTWIEEQKKKGN